VVDPTVSEFQRFAEYFDIEVSELLEIETGFRIMTSEQYPGRSPPGQAFRFYLFAGEQKGYRYNP